MTLQEQQGVPRTRSGALPLGLLGRLLARVCRLFVALADLQARHRFGRPARELLQLLAGWLLAEPVEVVGPRPNTTVPNRRLSPSDDPGATEERHASRATSAR